jgi:peptidoglycan/xylan/chitin deacetylase (PgdA/CDA1 family)/GT2 family glycosyltransferase
VNGPELSVVVPTWNRCRHVGDCLDALARQTLAPERFEVVVADDGSEDGTREMLAGLDPPFRLRVLGLRHAGGAAARNEGMRAARAPLAVFLDDDMLAGPGLLEAHLEAQRERRGVVALGRIDRLPAGGTGRLGRFQARELARHYAELDAGRPPRWDDCYSGNLSLPSGAFAAVGGFRAALTEMYDVELAFRLWKHGLEPVYVPGARAVESWSESIGHFSADAERRGAASVAIAGREPECLATLGLGGSAESSALSRGVCGLLLGLSVPPRAVALAAGAMPTSGTATRAYRFLESYCRWRGVRRAAGNRDSWLRLRDGTAILMYHVIGDDGEIASRYVVPERRFRRQMAWLRRRGYAVIDLDELVRCRVEHRLPPAKSVVLTFDDGYAETLGRALPVLERMGYPATAFLVTNGGACNAWSDDGPTNGRPLLTLADAAELRRRIRFGAHTRTHRSLRGLGATELDAEVGGSRAELAEVLDTEVTVFAYPYGDTDEAAEAAVSRAGFRAACGIEGGRNAPGHDLLSLRRVEVAGTDSLPRFAATLWAGRRPPEWHRSRG